MMNWRRLMGPAAIALAALAATVTAAQAQTRIAIGLAAGINQVPTLIAVEKGYFKEQGLDVDLKVVARGALALEGITGGSLQVAESAHVPFMAAVSKGLPLVAIGVSTRGFLGKLAAAPKNAHLKTLADFKGKRIGVQVGTGVHTVLLQLIERDGLRPEDFDIANLRTVDMPAAMAAPAHNFDAVIGWEPSIQRIIQGGHGKLVISAKQFEEMAQITYPFVLSTTREFRDKNADTVQRLLHAYAKAHKFARENRAETVRIYVAEVQRRGAKLTPEDVELMLYDTDRFGGPSLTDRDMTDLVNTRDFLIKNKMLSALPPFEQIVDRSFGEKAEQALR